MNIAVLLHSTAGGSGVVATELGLCFAREGHSVHFVANNVPFRLTNLHQHNVYFHQVQTMAYPLFNAPLTTLAETSKLAEVIEEYQIEIIHAHYAVPHATAALLARDMVAICSPHKPPVVVTTLHGTDVTLVGLDRAYLRTTQYSIEKSDKVTAVSQYLADYTHQEMGVKAPIEVIHNSVDLERFKPKANPELRLRYAHPDEKLLIHISNFREVKRTPDVISVFAKVAEKMGARLLMLGDGPERPKCIALAQELHIAGRVSFLGTFPQIEDLLSISDLFLLPSAKESFGLVALEAMSSGVPVVASDIGGIPEVIANGETGFTHILGDVEAMASSAIKLLSNDTLHTQFSKAARERAKTSFCEECIMPLYQKVYEEARARK